MTPSGIEPATFRLVAQCSKLRDSPLIRKLKFKQLYLVTLIKTLLSPPNTIWVTFMAASFLAFSPTIHTHFCFLQCLINLSTCSQLTIVSLITVSSSSCSDPEYNFAKLTENIDGLRTENGTHFNS